MPEDPVYTRNLVMAARLSRGGYMHVYVISRDGLSVGDQFAHRPTRAANLVQSWSHQGQTYGTWEAFRAAVEATVKARAART